MKYTLDFFKTKFELSYFQHNKFRTLRENVDAAPHAYRLFGWVWNRFGTTVFAHRIHIQKQRKIYHHVFA